jgi:hypothetical protein
MPVRTTEKPEQPNLSSEELEILATNQTELLSELWILRDRVRCLEHILIESGLLNQSIDDFQPSPEFVAELDAERDEFVARVAGAGHRRRIDIEELKAQVAKGKT